MHLALEPASDRELTNAVAFAEAAIEHTGDVVGRRLIDSLRQRPATNASVNMAMCVARANEMKNARKGPFSVPYDGMGPCFDRNDPAYNAAGLHCCGGGPDLEAIERRCGYCDEAAAEDPALEAMAHIYVRQCDEDAKYVATELRRAEATARATLVRPQ